MIKRIVEAAILRTCHTIYQEANTIVQRTMSEFFLASGPKIVVAVMEEGRIHTSLAEITTEATNTLLRQLDKQRHPQ
jgi:hypothetical protein